MPSPFRKDQLSPQMQERYGFNRKSWGLTSLITLVIIGFGAALIFVTYSLSQNSVQYRLLAWEELSADRVDITFEVRKPAELPVLCVVRAQDENRIDLGYAEVEIPAGSEYERLTYSLRTLAPAFTAELLTCVASGEPTRVPGPQFPAGIAPPQQPWSA